MESKLETAELKRILLEKIHIQACEWVDDSVIQMLNPAQIEMHMELTARKLVVHLDTYMMGLKEKTISIHEHWPKTWWDATKVRWFPKWALRRWPAQYNSIDIDQDIFKAVCPHVNCAPTKNHLEFMANMDNGVWPNGGKQSL